jgi:hypothetical protein
LTAAGSSERRPKNACPHCGAPLDVGFADFLPTKGRSGPVRLTCGACRGTARLATSSQLMAVVGLVVGLLGGAVAGARFGDSDQSTVIVLLLAAAGAFLLSFASGYAFLRLEPEGGPPPRSVRDRVLGKRSRRK